MLEGIIYVGAKHAHTHARALKDEWGPDYGTCVHSIDVPDSLAAYGLRGLVSRRKTTISTTTIYPPPILFSAFPF